MRLRGQLALGLILIFIIAFSSINVTLVTLACSHRNPAATLQTQSLPEWEYRNPINFSQPTPYPNTQVQIVLNQSNINYSRIHMNGHDLRFLTPDQISCDYWIATWNPNGISTIWVEVPQKGTEQIFMYYGNPTAQSMSNGTTTFLLFDDFNDGYFDLTLWNVTGGGTYNESNGFLHLKSGGPDNAQIIYEHPSQHYGEISVEFCMLVQSTDTTNGFMGLSNFSRSQIQEYYNPNRGAVYARLGEIWYYDLSCTFLGCIPAYIEPALPGFHTFTLTYTNTSFQIYRDNQQMLTQSTNATANGWYIHIRHWDTTKPAQQVDWVFIRRHHGDLTTHIGEPSHNGFPLLIPFTVGWLTLIILSWVFILSTMISNTRKKPPIE